MLQQLPSGIFAFELEFGALEKVARLSPRFRPLPRYPAVFRVNKVHEFILIFQKPRP